MPLTPFTSLLALSPDAAIALGSVGLGLIFLELNRPGRILPGAIGLLFLLLAVAPLVRAGLRPWATALLLTSAGLLLVNVWRALPAAVLGVDTLAGIFGLRYLVSPERSPEVRWPVAILFGALLGTSAAVLSRIAFRARRAKALD